MWWMIILILSFLIAANPAVYRTTRSVLGSWVATQEGTAKLGGLILHAFVFVLLVKLLKYTKQTVSGYGHWGDMDTRGDDVVNQTKSQEVPPNMAPAPYESN
jgi:hypothetical protein